LAVTAVPPIVTMSTIRAKVIDRGDFRLRIMPPRIQLRGITR
jgi:hypothetical protein